jgi:hypothetical protein
MKKIFLLIFLALSLSVFGQSKDEYFDTDIQESDEVTTQRFDDIDPDELAEIEQELGSADKQRLEELLDFVHDKNQQLLEDIDPDGDGVVDPVKLLQLARDGVIPNLGGKPSRGKAKPNKKTNNVHVERDGSEFKNLPFGKLKQIPDRDLKEQFEKSPILSKIPFKEFKEKLVEFFIKVVKDDDALPMLLKMSQKEGKGKFLGLLFATVILGWILKRIIKSKKSFFHPMTFILFIIRLSIVWGARIAIIVYFYGDELVPFVRIFKEVFL